MSFYKDSQKQKLKEITEIQNNQKTISKMSLVSPHIIIITLN